MNKTVISTKEAPAAIGPYSQAIQTDSFVFASGQLGFDMANGGEIPATIEEQTHCAMKNIGKILEAAGLTYANVVKTTIFVKNLGDFATINEIYASYFTGDYPARSCVEVAALPKAALVEIEVLALR